MSSNTTNLSSKLAESTLQPYDNIANQSTNCPVCESDIRAGDEAKAIVKKIAAKKLLTDKEKAECTRKCYNGGLAASMWASASD